MTKLSQKDVLRADQFSKDEIALIMDVARGYEQAMENGKKNSPFNIELVKSAL